MACDQLRQCRALKVLLFMVALHFGCLIIFDLCNWKTVNALALAPMHFEYNGSPRSRHRTRSNRLFGVCVLVSALLTLKSERVNIVSKLR